MIMDTKVKLYIDYSCEMAMVLDSNGDCIMMGNYWDFHPGCHGIEEYGDFNGPRSLATIAALKETGSVDYDVIDDIPWEKW
jgi:hypothetical protein